MLLLFSFSAFAANLSGKIEGFVLSSCGPKYCHQLISPVAYVSRLQGHMAFDEVELSFLERETNHKITLHSEDVYYDVVIGKIFVRETGKKKTENYIFDVGEQKLTKFN